MSLEIWCSVHLLSISHRSGLTSSNHPPNSTSNNMSTITIPKTHRAVTTVTEPKGYKIITKPLPVPADDEILVNVRAASLNRTDRKGLYIFNRAKDGNFVGNDFAGDVVHLGKGAVGKGVKLGDAVAGFVMAHRDPANSGFQECVKVLVFPKGNISYQQAAPFGIALSTTVQAVHHRLELPTPWAPAKEAFPILIWGCSTAVGIYAIKLAKLSGFLVAMNQDNSVLMLCSTISADFAKLSNWYRKAPAYLSELNVIPIKVWENGLDGGPDALEYLKTGKASAQKIVLNVS
ncbi:hypothetical protein FRB93_001139 [Tulasnella sp. JGI-2019a]|nr:hypothetical protein FRB93_001139 [Tulasnella sp. JGI-2019a]